MLKLLLDSNIIIDVINDRGGRLAQLQELIEQGTVLACTSINITEVYMGMLPKEADPTSRFLESLDFYPVTPAAARLAGELYSFWRKRGHTLEITDLTIAAVCIVNGIPLFTGNRKHFPMEEVQLYTPAP